MLLLMFLRRACDRWRIEVKDSEDLMSWKQLSRTVSRPVMFLHGGDGVMCADEVTAGCSKQISCLCDSDDPPSLGYFGSLGASQLRLSSYFFECFVCQHCLTKTFYVKHKLLCVSSPRLSRYFSNLNRIFLTSQRFNSSSLLAACSETNVRSSLRLVLSD